MCRANQRRWRQSVSQDSKQKATRATAYGNDAARLQATKKEGMKEKIHKQLTAKIFCFGDSDK